MSDSLACLREVSLREALLAEGEVHRIGQIVDGVEDRSV